MSPSTCIPRLVALSSMGSEMVEVPAARGEDGRGLRARPKRLLTSP